MRRLFAILFTTLLLCSYGGYAAENKLSVAVFDPSSTGTSIDEGTKIAIRELISSTIVNSGLYNLVERSLLEKVMQEQQFSNSGMVSENDATEIGKLAGANKIVLSVVTLTGGRNMLSIKMIDVQTAQVERQKVKLITSGELLDIVEPMTLETIGLQAHYHTNANMSNMPNQNTTVSQNSTPTTPRQQSNSHLLVKSEQTPVQRFGDLTAETSEEILEMANRHTLGQTPKPAAGEIVLYFAGHQAQKDKHEDLPLTIKFDKNNVGAGTIGDGFLIRLKNVTPGEHKVKIGAQNAIKINTANSNYFEFMCSEWKYLGAAMFTMVLVHQGQY